MRRITTYILLCLFTVIIAGCNRSAPPPTPTPTTTPIPSIATNTPVAQAAAPTSALATPTTASAAASSPLDMPTVPPPPIVPEPSPTPADAQPAGAPMPIPTHPQVECTAQDDRFNCYDPLLEMSFSYPAFMGALRETILRAGGYTGYGYEYMLDGNGNIGGRSRDFSEGRGGMYTDQLGFDGLSPTEICARWQAATCVEISPSVVMTVMYPTSAAFCADTMFPAIPPHSIIAVDLPTHPQINGFGFAVSLASPEWEAAFDAEWRSDDRMCDPAVKANFDAQMEQLRLDLEAGTADPAIQARYDAMLRLAESIQSPYVETAP